MRGVRYPSYGWHRAQHNTARQRMRLLAPLVEAGDRQKLLLHFLAGWLHDHATLRDRMMAAFVRNPERTHEAISVERRDEALPVSAGAACE